MVGDGVRGAVEDADALKGVDADAGEASVAGPPPCARHQLAILEPLLIINNIMLLKP